MKRLLLSLCLVPVLSFAANEPLKISQTAVDYCDITGDVLAQAYSTNKSAQELIDTALVKVKSEQLDLSKLKSNQAALQKICKSLSKVFAIIKPRSPLKKISLNHSMILLALVKSKPNCY